MARRKPVRKAGRKRAAGSPAAATRSATAVAKSILEQGGFERVVLALLRAEAAAQGRVLLVGSEIEPALAFADAVAPRGFADLPGPCVVLVYQGRVSTLMEQIDQVRGSGAAVGSIIVALAQDAAKTIVGILSRRLKLDLANVPHRIFTTRDLSTLLASHPAVAATFFAGHRTPESTQVLQKAAQQYARPRDDRKQREHYVEALRAAYARDSLALFLGAGVSKSVQFPDWNDLVKRVAIKLFERLAASRLTDREKDEAYEYFQSRIPASPLIVARLLRDSLGDDFTEQVRDALYTGASASAMSPLIKAIGSLCVPRRDRVGLAAVVSYNYDNLLQSELNTRNVPFRVVLSDGDEPLSGQLPIYHVHGFLERGSELSEVHKRALVLSEETYHNQFIDPYLWANLIQLNLLRNNTCLFVGMSLTDPNQRRLLEITFTKKPTVRHYAIMRDTWLDSGSKPLSGSIKALPRIFRGLEERSYERLGVSVIWVRDFAEIPEVIRSIQA